MFRPDQENERRDIQLLIKKKKKNFCQTFTDDARLKNVPPPLDLTRIIKSYHKRNDGRKFHGKEEQPIPREIAQLDWPKTAKHFSVNSCGKFLS